MPYGTIEVSGLINGRPDNYAQFLGSTSLCMPVEHSLKQEVDGFMIDARAGTRGPMYNDATRVLFEIIPPFTPASAPTQFYRRLPVIGRRASNKMGTCRIEYVGRWDRDEGKDIFRDRNGNVYIPPEVRPAPAGP